MRVKRRLEGARNAVPQSVPNRDEVADVYGDFVRGVARKLARDLRLSTDLEDLVQLGIIGLLEAWDRFDPDAGVPFRGFAWYRVRGAMIDGVKDLTGNTRAQLRQLRRMSASNEFQSSLSESMAGATDAESDASYLAQAVRGAVLVADVSEVVAASGGDVTDALSSLAGTPESLTSRRQQIERVRSAIAQMTPDAADLVRRHYFEDQSLAEIGRELGLSRSWLCRRHARAIRELHVLLSEEKEPDDATSVGPRRFISV